MKTRGIMFALVVAPLMLAGCQSSPCSTGWSFQVGKPATVQAQTVMNPTTTTFAGQGVAAGPLASDLALIAKEAATLAAPALLPMPRLAARAPLVSESSCTLDDVCRKLDALAVALSRIPTSQPMPRED